MESSGLAAYCGLGGKPGGERGDLGDGGGERGAGEQGGEVVGGVRGGVRAAGTDGAGLGAVVVGEAGALGPPPIS